MEVRATTSLAGAQDSPAQGFQHRVMALAGGDAVRGVEGEVWTLLDRLDVVNVEGRSARPP
jgi:hypothetical protein